MVEMKDHQQQETEGKPQFHSRLTSMAQVLVPSWNQMRVHIFEISQLKVRVQGTYWICNKLR